MRKARSLLLTIAGALLALTTAAAAQDYPTKPVRLIIPFPPGGSNDVVGRAFAIHLAEKLGKQVIVDNRGAGAGGIVGTEVVAHAPKDGYTIGIISIAHAVNPWLYKLPYDPIKAFEPVGSLASGPAVLAVHPDLPAHNVKELIDLAKAQPGKVQWGHAGIGSFQHLAGELFKLDAGVDILGIPFKGGGPAMIDVIGGHSKVLFSSMVSTMPQVKSGKLRGLATTGAKRSPVTPDLPTVAETVPGYEATNWWGIVVPAGTPAPIVARLHKAITEAQESPELQKQFASEGADVVRMSSAEFGGYMVSEMNKWEQVVKKGGIKAE
jgi:tripartite-type tricarboxylate transporter receptor subunit TctC